MLAAEKTGEGGFEAATKVEPSSDAAARRNVADRSAATKLSTASRQTAPMFDRIGRALADMAPLVSSATSSSSSGASSTTGAAVGAGAAVGGAAEQRAPWTAALLGDDRLSVRDAALQGDASFADSRRD